MTTAVYVDRDDVAPRFGIGDVVITPVGTGTVKAVLTGHYAVKLDIPMVSTMKDGPAVKLAVTCYKFEECE